MAQSNLDRVPGTENLPARTLRGVAVPPLFRSLLEIDEG
jgi:hypothetical protein